MRRPNISPWKQSVKDEWAAAHPYRPERAVIASTRHIARSLSLLDNARRRVRSLRPYTEHPSGFFTFSKRRRNRTVRHEERVAILESLAELWETELEEKLQREADEYDMASSFNWDEWDEYREQHYYDYAEPIGDPTPCSEPGCTICDPDEDYIAQKYGLYED